MKHLLQAALVGILISQASGQSRFATQVVQFNQGGGGGLFDPSLILGGPQGGGLSAGSLDVLSLGTGGDVTLAFEVTITNGPGADLIVFENAFAAGSGVYAEVVHVEVSTDGMVFARFPTLYRGPSGPFGAAPVPWGSFTGLPGSVPVLANVQINSVDPFDPVQAGGDALDLADLSETPEVLGGAVDLANIHFVRLVDVIGGSQVDSQGDLIWDSEGIGSADIDAVGVLHHLGNQASGMPEVRLWRDASDFLHIEITDPDGLSDIDFQSISASFNLQPLKVHRLLGKPMTVRLTPLGLHAVSRFPLTNRSLEAILAVSARDHTGHLSAAQISLHP